MMNDNLLKIANNLNGLNSILETSNIFQRCEKFKELPFGFHKRFEDLTKTMNFYRNSNTFSTITTQFNQVFNNSFFSQMERIREQFEYISNIASFPNDFVIKAKLFNNSFIITDNEIINEMQEKDIENPGAFLVDYYSKKNWLELSNLINKWDERYCDKERIVIIKDCFEILKVRVNNPHNAIVPSLIAQTEGIFKDLHFIIPKEKKNKIRNELGVKESATRKITYSYVKGELGHKTSIKTEKIGRDLFKGGREIKKDEGNGLYRNKVSHGDKDFLDYGKTENTLKLFLYINFLFEVIGKIKEIKNDKMI